MQIIIKKNYKKMKKNIKSIFLRFKTLLDGGMIKVSQRLLYLKLGAFPFLLEAFMMYLIIILGLCSCSTTKYLPVETIIVKDSVVIVKDTFTVEIPREKIINVVAKDTSSTLSTKFATSIARIEDNMLYHSLVQEGTLDVTVDTFYVTKVEERTEFVPVEVEKKYVPRWADYSLMLNVAVIAIVAVYMFIKFGR